MRLGRKLAVGVAEDATSDVPLVSTREEDAVRPPHSGAQVTIEDGRERQKAPAGWVAAG